jgi:hypothetical protein
MTDSEPRSSAPGGDRRGSEDRRKQNSGAPDGIERRKGERRKGHPDTAIKDADWENEGGATESGPQEGRVGLAAATGTGDQASTTLGQAVLSLRSS